MRYSACSSSRLLSFKDKLSRLSKEMDLREELYQHLWQNSVPTALWIHVYWVALIISKVYLEHGETGAPSSVRTRQRASQGWSS